MEKNLTIIQGSTYYYPIRWETTPIVYKAITGITQAAPCVVTAASHGVPNGWRIAVVSTVGMSELKAVGNPPYTSEYHPATVLTSNTIELNDVNSTEYTQYISGGYVQYNTPVDLTGYTARMTIKNKVGGTELYSLTTENGRLTITPAQYLIAITLTAAETAAITSWRHGVYDLELVNGAEVTALMTGKIDIDREVTT